MQRLRSWVEGRVDPVACDASYSDLAAFLRSLLERQLNAPFICRSGIANDNARVIKRTFRQFLLQAGVCRCTRAAAVRSWAWRMAVLMLLAAFALAPVRASDKNEQDRARAAVLAGEILPLVKVLERLQRTHPGQVLEVELEREDGRWVYEIKLLHNNGQLLKMHVDARTAAVLDSRSRQRP